MSKLAEQFDSLDIVGTGGGFLGREMAQMLSFVIDLDGRLPASIAGIPTNSLESRSSDYGHSLALVTIILGRSGNPEIVSLAIEPIMVPMVNMGIMTGRQSDNDTVQPEDRDLFVLQSSMDGVDQSIPVNLSTPFQLADFLEVLIVDESPISLSERNFLHAFGSRVYSVREVN